MLIDLNHKYDLPAHTGSICLGVKRHELPYLNKMSCISKLLGIFEEEQENRWDLMLHDKQYNVI